MHAVTTISYNNAMRDTHPFEKTALSILSVLVAIISDDPAVPAAIIVVLSGLILWKVKVGLLMYLRFLYIPMGFILLSIAAILITVSGPAATSGWGISLRLDPASLNRGGLLLARASASVVSLYFLIFSTPVVDIEIMLGKMKVPSIIRELFSLVYRYIFIITFMAANIVISQKSRMGYSTVKNRFRSVAMLAASVFVKSYLFSKKSYEALRSRGYNGTLDWIEHGYRVSVRNWTAILLFEAVLVVWPYRGVLWG